MSNENELSGYVSLTDITVFSETVLRGEDGKVYARRKDGERWRIEPDGVNIIEIGEAFGETKGEYYEFANIPPGTYRVLLERIGD